jgi:hypothetical protein
MNSIVLFNHHFLAVHDVDARLGGHAVDAVTATPHFRMVMIVFMFVSLSYTINPQALKECSATVPYQEAYPVRNPLVLFLGIQRRNER